MRRKIKLVCLGKNLDGDTKFSNPAMRKLWAQQFPDAEWQCEFTLLGRMDDKRKLFAYLFGCLLDVCLSHFEEAGYEFANTADLYKDFKGMFSKHMRINKLTGKEEVAIYDYSEDDVSVDLLSKFVADVILYMEQTFDNFQAPDSQSYKVARKFGANFKPASTFKPKDDGQ